MESSDPESRQDFEHVVQVLRQALWGDPGGQENAGAPKVWIEGVDETGLLVVGVRVGEATYSVRVPDLPTLAAIVGPPLRPSRDASSLKLPFQSRTAPSLGRREQALGEQPVALVCAGPSAQAMAGIESVKGQRLEGAVYTSRGPTEAAQGLEYKPFNEDAAVLRLSRRADGEVAAIGVFDQAGGEGAVEGTAGAASEAAAKCFDEAVQRIEAGADPEQALRESVRAASEAVRALKVGAVSTYAAAVVVSRGETRRAHVVAVGDSRILLVDSGGALKQSTRLHNFGARIAAGEVPDVPVQMALRFASALSKGLGTEDDVPDYYAWDVAPGDRLVAETDGLGDAREFEEMPPGVWHADRCAEDQARIVQHTATAADAVASLVGYALDQMADRYGKPDNIAVAVVSVLG